MYVVKSVHINQLLIAMHAGCNVLLTNTIEKYKEQQLSYLLACTTHLILIAWPSF